MLCTAQLPTYPEEISSFFRVKYFTFFNLHFLRKEQNKKFFNPSILSHNSSNKIHHITSLDSPLMTHHFTFETSRGLENNEVECIRKAEIKNVGLVRRKHTKQTPSLVIWPLPSNSDRFGTATKGEPHSRSCIRPLKQDPVFHLQSFQPIFFTYWHPYQSF